MTKVLDDKDFILLKGSLPPTFRDKLVNEEAILAQAYPLLDKICKNRDLIERLQIALKIPELPLDHDSVQQLMPRFQALVGQFKIDALFPYRLPIVLSEFPLHSRAINKAIASFNEVIESYHRKQINVLTNEPLAKCYHKILKAINKHGSFCDAESLWQILGLLAGWSNISTIDIYKKQESIVQPPSPIILKPSTDSPNPRMELIEPIEAQPEPPEPKMVPVDAPQAPLQAELDTSAVAIHELKQEVTSQVLNPFEPDYNYNINGAGRLASETNYLLLNAFGMKIGGHFDAQVKYPPRFIPLEQLHSMMRRQLSHRMKVKPTAEFQLWLELTLHQLGIGLIQKSEGEFSKDVLVNPFFKEPISFLSPEKINIVLKHTLANFSSKELNPTDPELEIIAQYLFELLQAFQINPGQALGIGANWDGTINLSNESGAQAFKFTETQTEWGRRFKQLSLHRQGPSEAKMNAAVGIKFEIQSLLSTFEHMSQLQPTEYAELLYNALVDNLVTDLFPEPAYFENPLYKKYRKQHFVNRNNEGVLAIDEFLQPSNQGIYFKDKEGHEKQTPMYRRAGTLDVQAFPKNTTYSEQSRVSYEGNPLGPLQLQYAQALHKTTRGHVVYDPIAPDQFIEDAFYGQVLRGDNGDYLPFIGVMPKNFDRHFNQSSELCASFVIRMLQSAHIIENCPTFKDAYEQLKTRFLPPKGSQPPTLPKFCSVYVEKKLEQLKNALAQDDRNFAECQTLFYGVFKNLIYSLYELGRDDEHFKHSFLPFINTRETFYPISKAKCEKLIRDFTVNRPVYVSPDSLGRYDELLTSLKILTGYFYPKPSDELAKIIATQARNQVQALLRSASIKKYFKSLKQNTQTNLSRKQTPGMLYAALKHDGPSKTVAEDYGRMHDHNFPSYYRDPDGTPNGEPQTNDQLMDWGAKKLGAMLQIMHKYHPLALLHRPISESILRGRKQAAKHQFDSFKALWVTKGILKGFFWHGVAIGTWETTTTPFKILRDFLSWQYHRIKKTPIAIESNPLAFSAAPANESSIKVLASANSRDFLLQMLSQQKTIALKKEELINYILQLANELYAYLTKTDLISLKQRLIASFPLTEANLNTLYNSTFPIDNEDLVAILNKYNPYINRSLIQAIFQCLSHPQFSRKPDEIIKKSQSAFSLNSKQIKVFKKIIELYKETSANKRQSFKDLFQFRGTIHTALLTRDQLLQKLQNLILKVFDEQWILETLFDHNIENIITELTLLNLNTVLKRLPHSLKWPLRELLVSDDPRCLNNYNLTEQHIGFLTKTYNLFKQIQEPAAKELCLNLCRVEAKQDENNLSLKDKAHNKWAKFAEKELKHQLLSLNEANDLLATLSGKLSKNNDFVPLIANLKLSYQNLMIQNDATINAFYEAACVIDTRLAQLIAKKKQDNLANYKNGATILKNFIDVTMNSIINARLDTIETTIFNNDMPLNPLISSMAITTWLVGVQQNNRNLRSLLEQQVQQAQSLDHSIWRCKSILQVLEAAKPAKKIDKTGMQSILRFWSQHRENVTITGERYIDSRTGEPNKASYPTLFKDSPTLEYAMKRVNEKLPRASIFSQLRKMEEINISACSKESVKDL